MKQRLLIIGNGMASVRLMDELDQHAPGRFSITVVGAERQAGYNRVLLSALLGGESTWADACLKPLTWYGERGIELVLGDAAVALDSDARSATLASGRTVPFDICVLATGSAPIRLPILGNDLPGVLTFRNADDVAAMTSAAAQDQRAVVIGGGLLGIEAACGLARRGVLVTLVHLMDRLMERQLDYEAAGLLRAALEAKGVSVLLKAETAEIYGKERIEGLRLKDGRRIGCNLVVMAAGIRPETALAKAAGLAVGRGVIVDDGLVTSHPDIHAIGECAEHRGVCYGLVEPAYEQARILARRLASLSSSWPGEDPAIQGRHNESPVSWPLDGRTTPSLAKACSIRSQTRKRVCVGGHDECGRGAHPIQTHCATGAHYSGSTVATNLKVSGVPVFSAGDFDVPGADAIITRDTLTPTYRKLVVRDGRLAGAILYGDTSDALWYLDLIRSQRAIGDIRPLLPFGRAYAEAA